jgi:hypothetical protein
MRANRVHPWVCVRGCEPSIVRHTDRSVGEQVYESSVGKWSPDRHPGADQPVRMVCEQPTRGELGDS